MEKYKGKSFKQNVEIMFAESGPCQGAKVLAQVGERKIKRRIMENQIDIIEKQIEQLKESIMNRYNESIGNIERDISYSKETALDRVLQTRIELIKELDDRLALIKQFPSVLDADLVSMKEIEGLTRIDFLGRMPGYHQLPVSGEGKWKVLILAKRIV